MQIKDCRTLYQVWIIITTFHQHCKVRNLTQLARVGFSFSQTTCMVLIQMCSNNNKIDHFYDYTVPVFCILFLHRRLQYSKKIQGITAFTQVQLCVKYVYGQIFLHFTHIVYIKENSDYVNLLVGLCDEIISSK